MPEILSDQLRDPVGYALPVFLLFIGLELLALRLTQDEPPAATRSTWTRTTPGSWSSLFGPPGWSPATGS